MPSNIESTEILKQKDISESKNIEFPVIGLADHNESELKWIQLHQMFDK